jgi:preprotein translocase subunit YajC
LAISPFLALLAQTTQQAVSATATTQPAAQEVPAFARIIQSLGMFPILAAILLLFWFSSRNKKKAEQQKQSLLNSMKRGVRVQTIGGILGSVVEVHPDWVLVKVDESNNTKVKFARSAIHRVLGEEAEAK